MRTLAGINAVISQSRLHYHTGCRDVRPLHRNTQPRVAASPTSGTDKHIVLPLVQELLIDLFYLPSNSLIIGSTVAVCLHIDNILNLVHNAMSQRIIRAKNHLIIRYIVQILIQHLLAIHNRTDLQKMESTRLILITT